MKIKISYQEHEEKRVKEFENWLKWRCELFGNVKVAKSDRHAPYKHIYIAVKEKT